MKAIIKPISLIFAILFGFLFSSQLNYLAKFASPVLFLMLFLAMCKIEKVFVKSFKKPMMNVTFAPFFVGILFYICLLLTLKNQSQTVISSALIILSPLATTAVVMVRVIGGNVAFTVMCIIFSHFFTVIFWPIFVYFSHFNVSFLQVTAKLLSVVLVPFFLSRIVIKTPLKKAIQSLDFLGFYLWVFCVLVNIASIAQMVKIGTLATQNLLIMAGISAGIFVLNYISGLIFSKNSPFPAETLQMFVQRNTIFGIWIANSFFSPVLAICPIFYLIFQNIYNSVRLVLQSKYETTKAK